MGNPKSKKHSEPLPNKENWNLEKDGKFGGYSSCKNMNLDFSEDPCKRMIDRMRFGNFQRRKRK